MAYLPTCCWSPKIYSATFYSCWRNEILTLHFSALSSFLRNFLITMLFAENVKEQGSRKESLVTKEIYPKINGLKKK